MMSLLCWVFLIKDGGDWQTNSLWKLLTLTWTILGTCDQLLLQVVSLPLDRRGNWTLTVVLNLLGWTLLRHRRNETLLAENDDAAQFNRISKKLTLATPSRQCYQYNTTSDTAWAYHSMTSPSQSWTHWQAMAPQRKNCCPCGLP